jgi:hypothetical protein
MKKAKVDKEVAKLDGQFFIVMIEEGSRFDSPDLTVRLVRATSPQDALFSLGMAIGCIDKNDIIEYKKDEGVYWQKALLEGIFSDETIGMVFTPTGDCVLGRRNEICGR